MTATPLVAFLSGVGRDAAGRSHAEILARDDDWLERRHDFIQWLFPLPEPSAAQPGSPVLREAEIAALRGSAEARLRMLKASERMLALYRATSAWRAPHDHNHLRITRVIRSLRLLVGDAEADAFRAAILAEVDRSGAPISRGSRRYWAEA